MKTIKLTIAWGMYSILFIVTIPISIIILGVGDTEYFWADYYQNRQPPKYVIKWFKFIELPFYLLNCK